MFCLIVLVFAHMCHISSGANGPEPKNPKKKKKKKNSRLWVTGPASVGNLFDFYVCRSIRCPLGLSCRERLDACHFCLVLTLREGSMNCKLPNCARQVVRLYGRSHSEEVKFASMNQRINSTTLSYNARQTSFLRDGISRATSVLVPADSLSSSFQ